MNAKIYFVHLSDGDIAKINSPGGGWHIDVGRRYQNAVAGRIDDTNFELLREVAWAEFEDGDIETHNETIWMRLQNGNEGDLPYSVHRTETGRSMNVGDVIVWDNGERYRIGRVGCERIDGGS